MSTEGPASTEAEQKQCRICLDGADPELGRLIRPCLCKGSISYVHVKCLQRWRTTAATRDAFYACPQCHYRYHFSRTKVFGMASNPVFIGMLATTFFTILVYVASFVATYFLDNLDEPSRTSGSFSFFWGTYWVSPFDVAKDLIKVALRLLQDQDMFLDESLFRGRPGPIPAALRPTSKPKGPIANFLRRVIIGVPVVGAASLVHLLWSVSMLTPFHFLTRLRGRNRREGSRDIAAFIILFAVVLGALRALWSVYRLTERAAKAVLLRAEDAILEVG